MGGWVHHLRRPCNHLSNLKYPSHQLRASYRIVDHRERQIAPHSLAFNLSADKLRTPSTKVVLSSLIIRLSEYIAALKTPSRFLMSIDQERGLVFQQRPQRKAKTDWKVNFDLDLPWSFLIYSHRDHIRSFILPFTGVRHVCSRQLGTYTIQHCSLQRVAGRDSHYVPWWGSSIGCLPGSLLPHRSYQDFINACQ